MSSTEITIMIVLVPFLAVWALLALSRRVQRRREERVVRGGQPLRQRDLLLIPAAEELDWLFDIVGRNLKLEHHAVGELPLSSHWNRS